MAIHLLDVVHVFWNVLEQLARARDEILRDVVSHAADANVAHGQAPAAAGFDKVVNLFSGAEAVPEIADGAEVYKVRADADQVVRNPAELREDHADVLRPLGDLDAEHLLDCHRIRYAVHHGGHVVEAISEGNHLPVHVRLRHLLEAPVQIADLGIGIDDLFAVNGHL